jgi:hypothetical protein
VPTLQSLLGCSGGRVLKRPDRTLRLVRPAVHFSLTRSLYPALCRRSRRKALQGLGGPVQLAGFVDVNGTCRLPGTDPSQAARAFDNRLEVVDS